MNGIGGGPSQTYPILSPTSPLGKPAVGLESPASKNWPVPPVEASAELYAARNEQRQATLGQALYENGRLAQAAAQQAAVQIAPVQNRPVSADSGTKNAENKSTTSPGEAGQTRLKRRLAEAFDAPPAPLGGIIDQRA